MEDKRFDDIIKGKLANLSSEATPRWDLFLEKKNQYAQKKSDKQFDNSLRESLSNHTVPYNSDHWVLLKERLERIYAIKTRLYTIKSYEVLALLLLTLGFGNIDSSYWNSANSYYPSIVLEETEEDNLRDNDVKIINQELLAEVEENDVTEGTNISTRKASTEHKTTTIKNTIVAENKSSLGKRNDLPNQRSVVDGNNNTNTTEAIVSHRTKENAINTPLDIIHESKGLLALAQSIDPIKSQLAPDGKTITLIKEGNTPKKKANKEYTDDSWLHFNVHFDNNVISTAYHPDYNVNGPTRGEMFGFSASVLYSFEKKAMEYETGLAYTSFDKLWNFSETFYAGPDVMKYFLTNVHFDIVSVPLRAKYHFVENEDWSLFLSGGLSLGVIANANYTENIDKIGLRTIRQGQPIPTRPDVITSPFQNTQPFTKGIFQGGSISDNVMANATLGIGMQRNITPMTSAYFMGDLQLGLLDNSYGPTQIERINKFSIGFGLKRKF